MTAMDTATLISLCANDVYRQFYGYVDRDDLVSEAHLWILEHPARMAHLAEDSEENPQRATYRLRRDLKMAMEIFARGEKATRAGYSREDEYFYDKAMLALLLPAVLAGDREPPQLDDGDAPRSIHDPAEGGNWLAMWIDVDKAWWTTELDTDERTIVTMRLAHEQTFEAIADGLDLSTSEAHRIYTRAEKRLIRTLGGQRPQDCPTSCECHEAPLRRRPGVRSNLSGADQLLG